MGLVRTLVRESLGGRGAGLVAHAPSGRKSEVGSDNVS